MSRLDELKKICCVLLSLGLAMLTIFGMPIAIFSSGESSALPLFLEVMRFLLNYCLLAGLFGMATIWIIRGYF